MENKSTYQPEMKLPGIKPARNPAYETAAQKTAAALSGQSAGGIVHQLAGDGARKSKDVTCFNLLTWIYQQENSAELMTNVYPAVMRYERPCPLICVCKSMAKSRALGHRLPFETEKGLPMFDRQA